MRRSKVSKSAAQFQLEKSFSSLYTIYVLVGMPDSSLYGSKVNCMVRRDKVSQNYLIRLKHQLAHILPSYTHKKCDDSAIILSWALFWLHPYTFDAYMGALTCQHVILCIIIFSHCVDTKPTIADKCFKVEIGWGE